MMRVERCTIDNLPDTLAAELDRYSLFCAPSFVRIWEAQGGQGVYWLAYDGNTICGALPAVEFRAKPLTRLQSMPDGLYARLYVRTEAESKRREIGGVICGAIARAGYARRFLVDYWNELETGSEFQTTAADTTVVDISAPDWQPPDSKLQSEIRKAERENVRIESFVAGKHLDKFMHLMTHTETRHGRTPKYSREFFVQLAQLAEKDSRVKWNVVEHEGEMAVAHINFVSDNLCLNWQIYFDKKFSPLKANQLMLYSMAKTAASEGIRFLNLGASPPDADSLRSYKDKWGGTPCQYRIHTRHSLLGRIL